MKYQIPRNVKTSFTFLGLEWKGWLLFLPTIALFGGLAFLLIPDIKARFIFIFFILGIAFFMYQVDEASGAMNFSFLVDFFTWYRSEKVIEPIWDGNFTNHKTIMIKTRGITKEDLSAYRLYLKEKDLKGEDEVHANPVYIEEEG